eukprot:234166_1
MTSSLRENRLISVRLFQTIKLETIFVYTRSTRSNEKNKDKLASQKKAFENIGMAIIEKLCANTIVIAGDSQAVRRSFIEVVSKYLFFRKCSMVLNILPCLYLNNYSSEHGIFRISCYSTKIQEYISKLGYFLFPIFFIF